MTFATWATIKGTHVMFLSSMRECLFGLFHQKSMRKHTCRINFPSNTKACIQRTHLCKLFTRVVIFVEHVLPGMNKNVALQGMFVCKLGITSVTFIWFLSSMIAKVQLQQNLLMKLFTTTATSIQHLFSISARLQQNLREYLTPCTHICQVSP